MGIKLDKYDALKFYCQRKDAVWCWREIITLLTEVTEVDRYLRFKQIQITREEIRQILKDYNMYEKVRRIWQIQRAYK